MRTYGQKSVRLLYCARGYRVCVRKIRKTILTHYPSTSKFVIWSHLRFITLATRQLHQRYQLIMRNIQ